MEKRSSYAILSGQMLIYIKISSQEGCFAKEAKKTKKSYLVTGMAFIYGDVTTKVTCLFGMKTGVF